MAANPVVVGGIGIVSLLALIGLGGGDKPDIDGEIIKELCGRLPTPWPEGGVAFFNGADHEGAMSAEQMAGLEDGDLVVMFARPRNVPTSTWYALPYRVKWAPAGEGAITLQLEVQCKINVNGTPLFPSPSSTGPSKEAAAMDFVGIVFGVASPTPAPEDEPAPVEPSDFTETPTPGRWYKVGADSSLKNKGHLRHVGKAYGLSAGTNARVAAAIVTNNHPLNVQFATYRECGGPEDPSFLRCSLEKKYLNVDDRGRADVVSYKPGQFVYYPAVPEGGW